MSQDEKLYEEEKDFPDNATDFVDERHIDLFAEALAMEEETISSPQSTSSNVSDYFNKQKDQFKRRKSIKNFNGEVVELIESQHDWLPIHKRLKKKKSTAMAGTNKHPEQLSFSITFKILRYPMLILILAWVMLLFMIYLLLRLYVTMYEYLFNWRGEKKILRDNLRQSKNYEEWVKNAKALDSYLGFDEWKNEDKYFYYDYKTLRKIIKDLSKFRNNQSPEELMSVLQSCLKENFAGTENPLLYSKTYYGTKKLVESYNDEVVKSLNYIIDNKDISSNDKKNFFKTVDKNYGKSALCLSGGASFAYNHFGVIKLLIDNDLLPKIISGTSGGGVVAALACSRTNEELSKILVPKLAHKITACNEPFSVWIRRWWKTGARFDAVDWAKKCSWFTKGGLTYQEMTRRTGKRLNISTVPSNPHSPVILCNEITSPNCIVWSSLLASSAVPGILNPVVLMMKDKTGQVIPFSFGNRWKDGSLRTDIPVEALNNYYNVRFSVVSQVNPHISLFFYAPKGSVGKPVTRRRVDGLRGGFLIATLEHLIKLDITKWLKLIRSLELFPRVMDQDWSNIWLQKFSGTITLWPRLYIRDLKYILSDPSEERLSKMLRNGEIATYPKILFIKHRLNIERCIERGKVSTRTTRLESVGSDDLEIRNEMIEGLDMKRVPVDSHDDFTTDDEEFVSSHPRAGFEFFKGSDEEEDEVDDDYYDSSSDE